MVRLSVVIATKDRPLRLKRCLSKLSSQSTAPFEIIIVDGSGKGYRHGFSALKKNGTGVNYINKKSSMVQARNIGMRHAKGDIVLFLDDDSFVEKDYVQNLLQFYESHPEAGGAEGNVVNERSRRLLARLMNLPRLPGREDIMRVHGLHGCNMSFRREVVRDFRFDESLIGYYNDDDEFCGRVSKKHKLFFVPTARLIHDQTRYGGARTDHYTNYNTLVFNQFYTLWRLPNKNIFDIAGYIFAQLLMITRAFIFVRERKYMAIKGIVRGYERAAIAIVKGRMHDSIREL